MACRDIAEQRDCRSSDRNLHENLRRGDLHRKCRLEPRIVQELILREDDCAKHPCFGWKCKVRKRSRRYNPAQVNLLLSPVALVRDVITGDNRHILGPGVGHLLVY